MFELPGPLPESLTVLILVVWAFFIGRWSGRRSASVSQRHRTSAQPVTYTPPAAGENYNHGAGIGRAAADAPLDAALKEDLLRLLRANRKIEAIKLARERLSIGLKEAKDLVESL